MSYGYDLLGHMTSAGDQNGWGATWTWDALGRLVTQASNVATTGFQYDPAGRMTRQTWGDGFYVTYDYDPTGNPVAVRENGVTALATYSYDALGRRTGITRGNGTSTSYGYDPVSRLASFGHDLAGTSADLTVTFGYNPSGQIVSRTGSNDAYSWTGYANGSSGYTADGLNRYTAAGTVAPTYDARGNTTSAGGASYGYNSRNQLYTTGGGGLWYRGPTGLLGQEPGVGNLDWVGDRLSTIQNSGIDRRYFTKSRDKQAALAFMKKALKRQGSPDRITTDDLRSYRAAMNELGNAQKQGWAPTPASGWRTATCRSDDESARCSGSGG